MEVKLFKFSQLPHTDIFKMAMELVGDNALDYTAFEYTINEFIKESESDVTSYDSDEIKRYQEIDAFLIGQGCAVDETIYLKL